MTQQHPQHVPVHRAMVEQLEELRAVTQTVLARHPEMANMLPQPAEAARLRQEWCAARALASMSPTQFRQRMAKLQRLMRLRESFVVGATFDVVFAVSEALDVDLQWEDATALVEEGLQRRAETPGGS